MFTTDFAYFKVDQEEYRRRADHYRLVKSLEDRGRFTARITSALGQLMVNLGQQLVGYAQLSH